jgi:hypothetical protein
MKPLHLALLGTWATLSAYGLTTPAPRIDTPSGQYTLTPITVEGTAAGGSSITSVQYLVNGNGPLTATQPNTNNWNKWQATIDLTAGSNLFQVYAVGSNGVSPTNSGHYFLVVKSPITVSIVGSGTIVKNYNGQQLVEDRKYTMVAMPGKGQVFKGWSGTESSTQESLTFLMQAGENLTATFEASPFTNGLTGVYDGLFYVAGNQSESNSGYLTLKLGGDGKFSGGVALDGQSNHFNSQFNAEGSAQWTVHRTKKTDLSFSVMLDLSGANGLTGSVSSASTNPALAFNATVQAYQELEEASNYDGYYNWAMNGSGTGGSGPEGHSYGTANVSPNGKVVINLFLSDGSTAFVSSRLTKGGFFPLYIPLYAREGSLSGWLTFTHIGLTSNPVDWFKDSIEHGPYTNGFALTGLSLALSPYLKGTNTLGTSNVVVTLSAGDISGVVTDFGTFRAKGIVPLSSSASNGVVSFNVTNGIFVGSFIDPADGKTNAIHGALVQPTMEALGYFIYSNHLSGNVLISPGSP